MGPAVYGVSPRPRHEHSIICLSLSLSVSLSLSLFLYMFMTCICIYTHTVAYGMAWQTQKRRQILDGWTECRGREDLVSRMAIHNREGRENEQNR